MASKEYYGHFAEKMRWQMEEKGISLKELSKIVDLTYEQCRKLSLGHSKPSRLSLPLVCDALGIPRDEGERLLAQDMAEAQGLTDIVAAAAGKIPDLAPIERVWPNLSERSKREIVEIAYMKARMDQQATNDAGE